MLFNVSPSPSQALPNRPQRSPGEPRNPSQTVGGGRNAITTCNTTSTGSRYLGRKMMRTSVSRVCLSDATCNINGHVKSGRFSFLGPCAWYMPNDPPFDLDLKRDRLHVAGASCRRPGSMLGLTAASRRLSTRGCCLAPPNPQAPNAWPQCQLEHLAAALALQHSAPSDLEHWSPVDLHAPTAAPRVASAKHQTAPGTSLVRH